MRWLKVDLLMPDYDALMVGAISAASNDAKWIGAKFEGIKTLANTHVGSVCQNFVEALCAELGLIHEFPMSAGRRLSQSPWDIRILGTTFELKTATEDTNRCFQFNHIRYHRTYDAALFIGVAPDEILFDCWSKADLVTGKAGRLNSMEAGANASYKFPRRRAIMHPIDQFENKIRLLVGSLSA